MDAAPLRGSRQEALGTSAGRAGRRPAQESLADYRRAIAIATEGLEHHPRNPGLHYQLACYTALAGEREAAIQHLLIAVAERPETAGWAVDDADLDALRGDPRFPA